MSPCNLEANSHPTIGLINLKKVFNFTLPDIQPLYVEAQQQDPSISISSEKSPQNRPRRDSKTVETSVIARGLLWSTSYFKKSSITDLCYS